MRVETTSLRDVLVFRPEPFRDGRGFFTRTFDTDVFDRAVTDHTSLSTTSRDFRQDSQSRSVTGVLRGLHGRKAAGEAKLVRCARGAVRDVLVDSRINSDTFGKWEAFTLDDVDCAHLFVPPGFLHGFVVLGGESDVCYRIDRPHEPSEDVAVRWDDADLSIDWTLSPNIVSDRDSAAGSWRDLVSTLHPTHR